MSDQGYPLYAVTIDVEVTDPEALHADAKARALEEGKLHAGGLLRGGDGDVGACPRMLFDPGVSPAGTTTTPNRKSVDIDIIVETCRAGFELRKPNAGERAVEALARAKRRGAEIQGGGMTAGGALVAGTVALVTLLGG